MDTESRALGIFLGLAVVFTVSFALLLVFSPPAKPTAVNPTVPDTARADTGTLDVMVTGAQTLVQAEFDTQFSTTPSAFALSISDNVEFAASFVSVANVTVTEAGFRGQVSFPSFPAALPLDREVLGNVSSTGGVPVVGGARYDVFSGTSGSPDVKWSWSVDGFVGNAWATENAFACANPVTSVTAARTASGNVVVLATTAGATEGRTGREEGPLDVVLSGPGIGTAETEASVRVAANNTISLLTLQGNNVRVTQSLDDGVTFAPGPQVISATGAGDVHLLYTTSGRVAVFRDTTVGASVEVVAEVAGVWTPQGTVPGLSTVESVGAGAHEGIPAVAAVDSSGRLRFARAEAADGSAWSIPVTVAVLAGATFGPVRLLERLNRWHLYYEYHGRLYVYVSNDATGAGEGWSGPWPVGTASGTFGVAVGQDDLANVTTLVSTDNGGHLLFHCNPSDLTVSWSASGVSV